MVTDLFPQNAMLPNALGNFFSICPWYSLKILNSCNLCLGSKMFLLLNRWRCHLGCNPRGSGLRKTSTQTLDQIGPHPLCLGIGVEAEAELEVEMEAMIE